MSRPEDIFEELEIKNYSYGGRKRRVRKTRKGGKKGGKKHSRRHRHRRSRKMRGGIVLPV